MKKKISAILGPTNTGKTYAAIQKLFRYQSGVIGFPLRLLARENYEIAKKKYTKKLVALITGEEKIIPSTAKYFFCTVESIPENQPFEFVAIDEVQMASDYNRGYIFTEKILNMRGTRETLFLGSKSIENILKKIFPDIVIIYKPRLSKLSYIGYKNITRLPKRSAIIAFSQVDVYEIANKIKQSHGGVSVVLGALSPDVRNAQVKLFEDEKVDYIVATDAIGMGLNLNIKNIFFTCLKKFDGFHERYLKYDEISQIAGRAGRFGNNGFFGTTGDLKNLNNDIVNFLENYEYTEIKNIFWRNNKLNFSSPKHLLNSLSRKSNEKFFRLKKNGDDHRYLRILLNDSEVESKIINPLKLKKLWEVCGVPDYSKNLDEYHTLFLKKIFLFLIGENKRIPNEWVKKNIEAIRRKSKKIAELNYKISQVRTWSFISYKKSWIETENKFQIEVRNLELRLSTKLHEELISEFIGEFKSIQISSYNDLVQKTEIVRLEDNKIFFGKENIGVVEGFNFRINSSFKKSKNIFNNKVLEKELSLEAKKITNEFKKAKFNFFDFSVDGTIYWKNQAIGKFEKGQHLLNPKMKSFLDNYFIKHEDQIMSRLKEFFKFLINKEMPFLPKIREANNISTSSRAINFCLLENLGHCEKSEIKNFFNQLSKSEIEQYKLLGFKTGVNFFYYNSKKLCFFKQMLINIFFKNSLKKFINANISSLSSDKKISKQIPFLKKMGFYLIKFNKETFLIHHLYFEKLSNKIFFLRKKQNIKFIPNNKFEKFFFKNPKSFLF